MSKAKLYLTESKWDRDADDEKRRPTFNVEKMQNSVEWTIGQTLSRKEVGDLISGGEADVTILKRKDQ